MTNSTRTHDPILLDRSKLLGFDQFSRTGDTTGLQGPNCAKVGQIKTSPAACLQVPNCAKVGQVKPSPAACLQTPGGAEV